jgi:nitroreductase
VNEWYDRIIKLRALRHYQDRPLSDNDVASIVEAARWTGSSKNRQNWSFVVVRDRSQIERLAECGDFTTPVLKAPATIALVEEPHGYEFDTGRLAQNIMLAADAIGVASCPITLHREKKAASVLELPKGRRCRYAVALGYAAPSATPANFGGRKPVADLLHLDRY